MGVSGSGKTTISRLLAEGLNGPFYDADNYHPTSNVAKMTAAIPLDDQDRAGWLADLEFMIRSGLEANQSGVITCSALKEQYRTILKVDPHQVKFIYLKADYNILLARMQNRSDHYMKPEMLQSQFDALDEPSDALVLHVSMTPDEIVHKIMKHLLQKNILWEFLVWGSWGVAWR
jgi:gluconokinase